MKIELSAGEIKFIMDLMMGCPLGFTKDHALQNDVNDSILYNHLEICHSAALSAERDPL